MTFVVDGAARREAAVAADRVAAGGALTVGAGRAASCDLIAGGEEESILLVRPRLDIAVVAERAIAEESGGTVEVAAGARHQ
jgi:hypothetical protein